MRRSFTFVQNSDEFTIPRLPWGQATSLIVRQQRREFINSFPDGQRWRLQIRSASFLGHFLGLLVRGFFGRLFALVGELAICLGWRQIRMFVICAFGAP